MLSVHAASRCRLRGDRLATRSRPGNGSVKSHRPDFPCSVKNSNGRPSLVTRPQRESGYFKRKIPKSSSRNNLHSPQRQLTCHRRTQGRGRGQAGRTGTTSSDHDMARAVGGWRGREIRAGEEPLSLTASEGAIVYPIYREILQRQFTECRDGRAGPRARTSA